MVRTAQRSRYDVADPVEEEEFGDDKGLHKHDAAGGDDGYEAYYVHDANGVEDYVTWTSQGAFKERHSCENWYRNSLWFFDTLEDSR